MEGAAMLGEYRCQRTLTGFRIVGLALFLSLMSILSSGRAHAVTITFDNAAGDLGDTYTEQAYQISNDHGLFSWGAGNPSTADTSGVSSTILNKMNGTETTFTKLGGGAFDLASIDFADRSNTGQTIRFSIAFSFYGGGTTYTTLTLDNLVGLQTFTFNQVNLASVAWLGLGNTNILQLDNVKVSSTTAATPLPATLPLFAAALAGLGIVARRRKLFGDT
jgi:hypothetical protein